MHTPQQWLWTIVTKSQWNEFKVIILAESTGCRSHMLVVRSAAARGRCGLTAEPRRNSQQIHHFITFPFSPSFPPSWHQHFCSRSVLLGAFTHILLYLCSWSCSLPLSNTCKCFSRPADAVDHQRGCLFWQTYLSVLLQIRFISYEDHGKFISVFYS